MAGAEPPELKSQPRRLEGWREIAGHLGKAVRTAQRWEKQYGLPVRRAAAGGTETVFAFAHEVDRWAVENAALHAEDADADAQPHDDAAVWRTSVAAVTPRRPRAVVAVVACVLVAALAIGYTVRARRRAPASWRIVDQTLFVFDGAGRPLFSHRIGLGAAWPPELARREGPDTQPVHLADIDGDGTPEVLLIPPVGRDGHWLYCFDADGRTRFVHRLTRAVHFGGVEYDEPWFACRLAVVARRGGAPTVWLVSSHHTWFPSVAQAIGPDGSVRAEFWNDGHLNVVREVVLGGRERVVIGGTNNELRGAALAVFDRGRVAGHAPAVRADYACEDCPAGLPDAYLVFPSSCLYRRSATGATVTDVRVAGGRLVVEIAAGNGRDDGIGDGSETTVEYTLDERLQPVAARLGGDFVRLHGAYAARRLLDHPLGVDEANLFPIVRFEADRFVPLPAARVTR